MSGRQSGAVDRALRELLKREGNVYRIAAKHGVYASTLYRAWKRATGKNSFKAA